VDHFLKKHSGNTKKISQEAIELFLDYPWKGNVRELENIIERVTILCDAELIDTDDLPEEIRVKSSSMTLNFPAGGINLEKMVEDLEKGYLIKALEKTNGVKTEAAKLLNLSFRSFRHRLKKYNIEKRIITD
jgi:two-component system response regulator PilR (NtrC family)